MCIHMYVGCAVCKTCFQRVYTQYFRRFSFEMRRLVGAYECAREHTNAAETASAHSASTHTNTPAYCTGSGYGALAFMRPYLRCTFAVRSRTLKAVPERGGCCIVGGVVAGCRCQRPRMPSNRTLSSSVGMGRTGFARKNKTQTHEYAAHASTDSTNIIR